MAQQKAKSKREVTHTVMKERRVNCTY